MEEGVSIWPCCASATGCRTSPGGQTARHVKMVVCASPGTPGPPGQARRPRMISKQHGPHLHPDPAGLGVPKRMGRAQHPTPPESSAPATGWPWPGPPRPPGIILQPTFIVGCAALGGAGPLLLEWGEGQVGPYALYPHRRFVSAKGALLHRIRAGAQFPGAPLLGQGDLSPGPGGGHQLSHQQVIPAGSSASVAGAGARRRARPPQRIGQG